MNAIRIDELARGDVLLYRANWRNLVAWMIRWLDGTEVSHAGLYLGDRKVGEALKETGLRVNSLSASIADSDWVAVMRLKDEGIDAHPVLDRAGNYLKGDNPYAIAQCLLLGWILFTRKTDMASEWLRRVAIVTFEMGNYFLRETFREGREPMICSEFVFRVYQEAMPGSLMILPQATFGRLEDGSRASPESDLPAVHPGSLFAELRANPERLEQPPMTAARAPHSDEELDELIREYLVEVGVMKAAGPRLRMTSPAPSYSEVKTASEAFASALADSSVVTDRVARRSAGTGWIDRLIALAPNFVTPGDLYRSPSLKTIGPLPSRVGGTSSGE